MRLWILALVIISMLGTTSYALLMPVGIAGRITIDNIPMNNIQVKLLNLNTGEQRTVLTRQAGNGENGWFICALGANTGQKVEAFIQYQGRTYTKEITVDLKTVTQYINITISTAKSHASPNNPPIANFTWTPHPLYVNTTVTFIDSSKDSDNDIVSKTWDVDNHTYHGQTVTYIFTQPGYNFVSLTVLDSAGNIDICQKRVYVYSQTIPKQNETNKPSQPQNISLLITIKDRENNTIPTAKVEIYHNNTIVQTVYTNDSGIAVASLPPDSYKIKAYYGNQVVTKNMQFSNNGRVTFLFNPKSSTQQVPNTSLPYIPMLITISIVVLVAAIIWFIFVNKREWYK